MRKHISLERKYEDKIKPFLQKHQGNFSAAVRELIDIAIDRRIALTHSESVLIFDAAIANFLLRMTEGILPEKEILYEMADPLMFNSVSNTLEYFKIKFNELGWDLEFNIQCDSDTIPTTAVLTIKGGNYHLIKLSAKIFSLFMAYHKRLGIEQVHPKSKSIKLKYILRVSAQAAINDLNKYIGTMQELFSEIEKRPGFWQRIVEKYRDSNYKMVVVHFNNYEDLLAKKTPKGDIGIELIAKRPVKDIPHREFLQIMKQVYESAGVVDNIDIEGDTVKVFHSYRNPISVNTLTKIFLNLFRNNGHTYDAKSTSNLIMLRHMPEIGIRISELIANLNKSGSDFDKELIAFLTFLNGLKDTPDMSESIRVLGYMMSKQIFTQYEKEHKILSWDLTTFKKALSILDSKIGRISECRSINEKSMCYSVKKCNLVEIGGEFNIDICQFSRGFFKGALEYVFKDDAEIEVIKLLTHGDDCCEVCIHVHNSHMH